jgi:hypothetical protein
MRMNFSIFDHRSKYLLNEIEIKTADEMAETGYLLVSIPYELVVLRGFSSIDARFSGHRSNIEYQC